MSHAEVQAFFETYREAFNRLDGDAVADLWHTPSAIANRGEAAAQLTWWSEDEPMRANHRGLCGLYRGNGYRRAEFEIADCVSLGADHAFANLHWTLWRANNSLQQAFHTGYNLMGTASGPKVLLVAAYEEDLEEIKRHAAE